MDGLTLQSFFLFNLVDPCTHWLAFWNLWVYDSFHPRSAKNLPEVDFQGWIFFKRFLKSNRCGFSQGTLTTGHDRQS